VIGIFFLTRAGRTAGGFLREAWQAKSCLDMARIPEGVRAIAFYVERGGARELAWHWRREASERLPVPLRSGRSRGQKGGVRLSSVCAARLKLGGASGTSSKPQC
jgi:hypothetical protein